MPLIIENKQTTIKESPGSETFLTIGDLIIIACLSSSGVMPLAEQRIRFKLVDACEAGNGVIEIDEKWVEVLKKCLEGIQTSLDKTYAEFGEQLEQSNQK